jgi:glutaconyl-CoA/methylmalonyl-CoA decarboxylase subunit gamma
MKRFLIKVNGVAYDVEVENAGQSPVPVAPTPAQAAVVAHPAIANPVPAAVPPAPVVVSAAASKAGSWPIKAPMPGTVLAIQASPGQPVKKNQVLLVLEAMKMENEIVSPRDGIIAGVHTAKGSSVNAGDLLVSLE